MIETVSQQQSSCVDHFQEDPTVVVVVVAQTLQVRGLRAQGLQFRFRGLRFRLQGLRYRFRGLRYRFRDVRFRLRGLRYRFREVPFRFRGLQFRFRRGRYRFQRLRLQFRGRVVALAPRVRAVVRLRARVRLKALANRVATLASRVVALVSRAKALALQLRALRLRARRLRALRLRAVILTFGTGALTLGEDITDLEVGTTLSGIGIPHTTAECVEIIPKFTKRKFCTYINGEFTCVRIFLSLENPFLTLSTVFLKNRKFIISSPFDIHRPHFCRYHK